MGVYSLNNNVFDVWLTLVIGAIGYVMRLFRFEPAPLLTELAQRGATFHG